MKYGGCPYQCDQMKELKVAQFLKSCPKRRHSSFYINNGMSSKSPKRHNINGDTFKRTFLTNALKNYRNLVTLLKAQNSWALGQFSSARLCWDILWRMLLMSSTKFREAWLCNDEFTHSGWFKIIVTWLQTSNHSAIFQHYISCDKILFMASIPVSRSCQITHLGT